MTLHPLVQRLAERHGAAGLTLESLDAWAARPGEHALFFSGDAVRFPETLDVAVVLPELRAAFGQRFDLGLVPRDEEDAMARRYGVQRWPALVFLREGGYLATVSGMQDWSDYLGAVGAALDAAVSRPPTIGIPVVADGASATCH
jgi:hydrogenase-1 operon protein HyaE